jgi:hypothetical protein
MKIELELTFRSGNKALLMLALQDGSIPCRMHTKFL